MARYIDADKLISEYDRVHIGVPGGARKLMVEAPTADVVPRKEAEKWYQLYHSIKEELKQEKMYHRATENLCDRYCIESQHAKQEVAREIFEEIEFEIHQLDFDRDETRAIAIEGIIANVKKKYLEVNNEKILL